MSIVCIAVANLKKNDSLGFTLIEMSITLVIVAILASLAIPSFQDLVEHYRIQSVSMEFSATLAYARSEAIKRGQMVTICPTTNRNLNTCGNLNDWQNGWIVFLDTNQNGILSNNQDRLRIRHALKETTLTTNQARISFNSRGFVSTGISTFKISTPHCTGQYARLFELSNTGRPTIRTVSC